MGAEKGRAETMVGTQHQVEELGFFPGPMGKAGSRGGVAGPSGRWAGRETGQGRLVQRSRWGQEPGVEQSPGLGTWGPTTCPGNSWGHCQGLRATGLGATHLVRCVTVEGAGSHKPEDAEVRTGGAPRAETESPGVSDLALRFQICLVPDQHDGEVVAVLDSEDLREELAHLIETAEEAQRGEVQLLSPAPAPPRPGSTTSPLLSPLPVVNGKHQQEPVPGAHVLLPHGAELLLARGVQDCRDGEGAAMWTRLP